MYKTLDLFAGAGGLSLGFEQEGHFKVVGVVENNENALKTYLSNRDADSIKVDRDIRQLDLDKFKEEIGDVDVIIGGPPCQGFSNANRQKAKFISLNNALVKKYADVVLTLSPRAFVMENVAMLKSNVHKFFDSRLDHDEVMKLNVEMREERHTIMNRNPDGADMLSLLQSEERVRLYALDEGTFRCVKLLRRYLNDEARRDNYFNHYANRIISSLSNYKTQIENDATGKIVAEYVDGLVESYRLRRVGQDDVERINDFIEFLTAVNLMVELYDNGIIFELTESDDSKSGGSRIEAKIKSYTVCDYLNKRLSERYAIDSRVLNAKDYGVPQERRRFILIGVNRDYKADCDITFPKPSQGVNTVRDAIGDLEEYEPSKSVEDKPMRRRSKASNNFTRRLQDGAKSIFNHVTPGTREIALERFKHIEQGDNFHSLDIELKENTYSNPSRTQNTVYLRLKYDDICGTVVNVRKSMWIHPAKDRAISIREAARLQTFPDSYIFYGPKDSQYQQVGNAVPPFLAKAIAGELYKILER